MAIGPLNPDLSKQIYGLSLRLELNEQIQSLSPTVPKAPEYDPERTVKLVNNLFLD